MLFFWLMCYMQFTDLVSNLAMFGTHCKVCVRIIAVLQSHTSVDLRVVIPKHATYVKITLLSPTGVGNTITFT